MQLLDASFDGRYVDDLYLRLLLPTNHIGQNKALPSEGAAFEYHCYPDRRESEFSLYSVLRHNVYEQEITMKLSERVRPISYLKSHAAEIVRDFEENRSPLIVTQNGEAKIVVMDIRTYEEQIETMAFLKLINLGKKDISEGNFQSVEDFFADMEKEEG